MTATGTSIGQTHTTDTSDTDGGSQVKDKAGEVASRAKDKASEGAAKAKEAARKAADDKKTAITERGETVVDEADKIASQLRSDGMDKPAEVLETITSEAREALDYIEANSVDEMLRDVGRLARQRPLVFGAGTFAIGFAAVRLIRAGADSAEADNAARSQQSMEPPVIPAVVSVRATRVTAVPAPPAPPTDGRAF